jgi:hypothetical protein
VYGRDGADLVRAGAGDGGVRGGRGGDLVYGGRGNDPVAGSNGNDRLYGGSDADQSSAATVPIASRPPGPGSRLRKRRPDSLFGCENTDATRKRTVRRDREKAWLHHPGLLSFTNRIPAANHPTAPRRRAAVTM